MADIITIDAVIPNDERARPVIIVFDNGDWEVAFAGDAEYVKDQTGNVLCVIPFIDAYTALSVFLECGDEDDFNLEADELDLYLYESVDEPLALLVMETGDYEIETERVAFAKIEDAVDGSYNYLPIVDLIEEFDHWYTKHQENESYELADEDDEFEDD